MDSSKIRFKSHSLGDKLATVYSMENCGRQTGRQFEITGHELGQQICAIFDLQHVRYTEDESNSIVTTDMKTPAVSGIPYAPYIYRIMKHLEMLHDYQPDLATPLNTKVCHMRGNYTVCQFDSRFAAREGFLLKHTEIKRIIRNKIGRERMFLIGGKETQKYIPQCEYKLGDLDYLLELVVNAKRFVGVDSGIAHLAGMVGTPTEVCFLMPRTFIPSGWEASDEPNPLPIEFFTRSYKNVTVFKRGEPGSTSPGQKPSQKK